MPVAVGRVIFVDWGAAGRQAVEEARVIKGPCATKRAARRTVDRSMPLEVASTSEGAGRERVRRFDTRDGRRRGTVPTRAETFLEFFWACFWDEVHECIE